MQKRTEHGDAFELLESLSDGAAMRTVFTSYVSGSSKGRVKAIGHYWIQ